MMHICASKLTIIGSNNGLSPGRRPGYLNQCWNIVNWTHGNKVQWNFNWSSYIFIQQNSFENVVWKMAAILSWPQCVKQFSAREWFILYHFWDMQVPITCNALFIALFGSKELHIYEWQLTFAIISNLTWVSLKWATNLFCGNRTITKKSRDRQSE